MTFDDEVGWPDTICVPLGVADRCEWFEVPVTADLIKAIRRAMTPPANKPHILRHATATNGG